MADSKVFVKDPGGGFAPVAVNRFASEDMLQELLAAHPDILDGAQLSDGEPLRWLFVGREIGIPGSAGGSDRFSVDHLLIDQDGVATLVEVKRSTDTRLRREVVGQMLDYAANALRHWPLSRLREHVAALHGSDVEPVKDLLGAHDEETVERWWELVGQRLADGEIRMVFVADKVPTELQAIVEFLNERLDRAEVIALEVARFASDGLEIVVPRLIGRTAVAKRRKHGSTAGYEVQRRNASPAFRELEEQLDAWARASGLATRVGDKSLRLETSEGVHVASLYPQWERLEFFLASMWESDQQHVAQQTSRALEVMAGESLSAKQPGLRATTALAHWNALTEDVLPAYIHAREAMNRART